MHRPVRILVAILLACVTALAAAEGEATWSAHLDRSDVRAGEVARVVIDVKLKAGWHAYSIVPVADGPFPTTIRPPKGDGVESAGAVSEQPPHVLLDPGFKKRVGTFEGSGEFYAPIRVKRGVSGPQKLTVDLKYMVCNDQTCLPPTDVSLPVDFAVQSGSPRPEYLTAAAAPPTSPTAEAGPVDAAAAQIQKAAAAGPLPLILLAFGFGLLSLLTPCVFPMIPVTVSFFSKQKQGEGKLNVAGPVAYSLGIIGTFTGLGVIVGASGLNKIATNVWVNLALAALFIVLAASLFGVFEIRLPSWLVNKASSKSRSGGLLGPVLMGLTFTMTSFTCTVPFVGTILAQSSREGLKDSIIGMLAYSTAFALPFFLLALFPSALAKLPRSGAWLVTVKAFMGFLELMAALKFASNVDLALELAWLTKPVFLAVWSITAAVGGLYLLGWVRLPHDAESKIGWLRRGFGVATLALAVFCLRGMNGGDLGKLSAFLPPDPYPGQAGPERGGLVWESSYDTALAKAKASGRNVLIDFTGIFCTNCRLVEEQVFTLPRVKRQLGDFVLAKLYTDRSVPETDANKRLEYRMAKVDTLPLYVVVSPEGKVLKIHQQEPPLDDAEQFLDAIRPFAAPQVASNAGQPGS